METASSFQILVRVGGLVIITGLLWVCPSFLNLDVFYGSCLSLSRRENMSSRMAIFHELWLIWRLLSVSVLSDIPSMVPSFG